MKFLCSPVTRANFRAKTEELVGEFAMSTRICVRMACFGALFALSACGGGDEPRLMNLRGATNGPDEFSILPTKPLSMPPSLAELPEPTPGAANLTDPTPLDDAVAALGGARGARKGVDGGIVSYASRMGVDAGIRQELAQQDLEFREKNQGRFFERLFKTNVYFKAYADEQLDQEAELTRWRKAGVRTPSAPPAAALVQ